MQPMEISDNIEQPRDGSKKKNSGEGNQSEERLCKLLFLSFGALCIIQAILNLSLRLTSYSTNGSTHSDCNPTQEMDCERRWLAEHNRLQERVNALMRDRSLLENRNTELTNMLRNVGEERDRLLLRELSGSASLEQCPAGWRQINSRCYFLSTERKTWRESRQYCQSKGADLVVINSEQEQRALYRVDGDNYLSFWIGLYDTAGTYKWVDGSPLTRTFWQPGHGGPNNGENCVEMYHFKPVLASWSDTPCRQAQHWLCEKDPSTSS